MRFNAVWKAPFDIFKKFSRQGSAVPCHAKEALEDAYWKISVTDL